MFMLKTAVSMLKKWVKLLQIVWKQNFRELMNYDFTAQMEDSLDQVANNRPSGKPCWTNSSANSASSLETAEKDPEEGGMRPNQMVLTSIDCPTCGRPMGIRTASTGVFLGCSGYALPPKERCKTTINLIAGERSAQRAGRG